MSKTEREMVEEMYKIEPDPLKAFDLAIDCAMLSKPIVHDERVRGDGGFTNYYAVPKGATQLSDLIYYKGMNHSIGEAFCALYRMNDNGEKVRNIKKVIRYMELELEKAML